MARPQRAQSPLTSNLSSRGSKLRGDGDDSGDDDRRTSEKERRKFRKDSCAQQERERGDARFPVITLNVVRTDPADNRYLECALEGAADYVED